MNSFKCLAVDMGAGSVRVLCGEISDEKISYHEIFRFKNEIKTIDGIDKWDIDFIYKQILEGLKMALLKHPDAQSIGVDSWGVDYVLLDAEGKLIEIPYAYRDSRTEGMHESWRKHMADLETYEKTGINFYPFNTLFQLLAAKNDDNLNKASRILFIPNYIYYRLTGKQFNELTIASTSQLLESNSSEFSSEILQNLGLKPDLFGEVIHPGLRFGSVADTELPENNLEGVSVCCHDTASAVAAIPSDKKKFAFISTGTWCIVGIESESPILSEKALELGFTNERGYGNTYRVLNNIVGLWLLQGLKDDFPEINDFSQLENMAKLSEPSDHIVDPEDALFYNPKSMLQAFNDFFVKTGQPLPKSIGQYIRCAYNSLSLSFSYYIEKLEELTGNKYDELHLVGGGCQSENLCQATANQTGKIVLAGPVECAALGNILVQTIAMNQIENISKGRELIKKSYSLAEYKCLISESERNHYYKRFKKLKNKEYVK